MDVSVKIMNSYDYSHFEMTLSEGSLNLHEANELRKEAQRLVDKAIQQYKKAKAIESERINLAGEIDKMRREVRIIKENFPESEWTPEQKAKVKVLADREFFINSQYDYQDDWEEEYGGCDGK